MPFVNLLQVVYPVGAFYFSNLATSPSSIIGGTWMQITDATIRGASGATGYTGSDSHTITVDEMPRHNHDVKGYGAALASGNTGWRVGGGGKETVDNIVVPKGGGQPMSVAQRSYNCYVWYRIA